MDERLWCLSRELRIVGTTLAARQGRRRPRGNRGWKRGTLNGWWVGWGNDGNRREYSVSAGYAKVDARFAVIVSAFPRQRLGRNGHFAFIAVGLGSSAGNEHFSKGAVQGGTVRRRGV